jgi:hypothetical protein
VKGYLLKEQKIQIGEAIYIESNALENNFSVMFEDDTDSGYFYGGVKTADTAELRIVDMLHIYDVKSIAETERQATLSIVWSADWLKCALVINNYCHAVFDFENQGGYNRNEFPPPNEIWTKQERKLKDEMITRLFT